MAMHALRHHARSACWLQLHLRIWVDVGDGVEGDVDAARADVALHAVDATPKQVDQVLLHVQGQVGRCAVEQLGRDPAHDTIISRCCSMACRCTAGANSSAEQKAL